MGKEPMAEYVLKSAADVAPEIQKKILNELLSYFFVGGMPECIKTYRDSSSMIEAFKVQSEILDSYRDDFFKYTPKIDITCLDAVFLNTAKSIGEQLKYTRLNAGHSGQMNHKAAGTGRPPNVDTGNLSWQESAHNHPGKGLCPS